MAPQHAALLGTLSLLTCAGTAGVDISALQGGSQWVSRSVPPGLVGRVREYEHTQVFGIRNDPFGWRATTRYTLIAGQNSGCRFIEWIPGSWSVRGSILIVRTPTADSGAAELYECPGGPSHRALHRAPHFTEAETRFDLTGRMLVLERRFGSEPPHSVTLMRKE